MKNPLLKLLKPSSFKIGLLTVLASVLLFHSFGYHKPPLLQAMDNRIVDVMFNWRGVAPPTGKIVIADIDEKSLGEIGQWPWSRNVMAKLVENLAGGGAKVIGFDIVFAEKDRTSPALFLAGLRQLLDERLAGELEQFKDDETLNYDLVFGNAVAKAPVVLGYVFQLQNDGLKTAAAKPFPSCNIRLEPGGLEFNELDLIPGYRAVLNVEDVAQAETEGFFNVFPDPSGMVRKVPLFMIMDDVPYPALGLEMLRLGQGKKEVVIQVSQHLKKRKKALIGVSLAGRFIPTDEKGQIAINYRGPVKTFPYVPASDIIQGLNLERIRDKYVLVGSSAAGLLDLRATPFSNVFPGTEVHANLLDNVLAGDPLNHDISTEIGLTYLLILGGGLLLCLLLAYSGPLLGGAGGLLLMAAAVLGNYHVFFLQNRIVGLTYPMLVISAVFLIVSVFNYFFESRDKKFIHNAFGHYVSPGVVSELMKNPESLSLAGSQKVLTIFFNDIRGFTAISEHMSSEQLGIFMNRYLTAMSDIIMANKGTVDKFIGDAIMAIWGAPQEDREHAVNGVRTALAMVAGLKELRPAWEKEGFPVIDIGIGLNTGMVSVGNFGSDRRFDYTVIGDNVNLASRLEGLNKAYGTNVIISESTREAVGGLFFCRLLDIVRVKGKEQPVRIYEPLVEGEPAPELRQEVETYEKALEDYRRQRFAAAHSAIEKLQQANPLKLYNLYLDRIELFQAMPPAKNWDGVFTFTAK